MNQENLTREDFEVIGLNLDDGTFELMKTYYMASGDSKEAFLKYCSLGNDKFWEYLVGSLTSRVFELQRTIAVNEVRDKETEDSLLDVLDMLNKIKNKGGMTIGAIALADNCLNTLESVLVGYNSKMNIIIKKAKKHVELSTEEIDYLVEIGKNLKKD